MCKKSFDKTLRRDAFPVCKINITEVAKRLSRIFSLNIYAADTYFNGRYVPYSRTPARKPNAYFIAMLQLLLERPRQEQTLYALSILFIVEA